MAIAIETKFVVMEYLEGLQNSISANRIMNPNLGLVRLDPEFMYTADKVDIANVATPGAVHDVAASSDAGGDPTSMAAATVEATVRRLTISTKILEKEKLKLERNLISGRTLNGIVVEGFQANGTKQFATQVMAAITGVESGMVLDISGASGAAADISRTALLNTKKLFGDEIEDVVGWLMHSAQESACANLTNDAGTPYYVRDAQGRLIVEGVPVIVTDIGTNPSSGIYATFLVRRGAVAFGAEELESTDGNASDEGNGIRAFAYPSTTAGGAANTVYQLTQHYYCHLFSKIDGFYRGGVAKLISK